MRKLILFLALTPMAWGAVTPASAGNDRINHFLASPASLTYPNATAAGDLLWLSIAGDSAAPGSFVVTGVTDTSGGTWALGCRVAGFGSDTAGEIWYAPNSTAHAAPVVTVTYTGGGLANMAIHEATNVALSSPVDAGSCKTGSNASSSSPLTATMTTTGSNDYIVSAVVINNGGPTVTAGSGFSNLFSVGGGFEGLADESGAFAAGSHAGSFGFSSNASWNIIAVAFLPLLPPPFYTLSGPASGKFGVASTNFTLTPATPPFAAGTITLTSSVSGGAWICSTGATGTTAVTITATGLNSFTCTYQAAHPYDARVATITPTNAQGWQDPTNTTYQTGFDCTSAAAAGWATNSTWTGCGGTYPQNGDTAALGHIVTVSTSVTVGISPATSGTAAINLGTVGAVTIASGGTLQTRGDTLYDPAGTTTAVTVQGGGIWEFDASQAATPASQHYVFGQTNQLGKRTFLVSGSSGSHAVVRSNGSGGVGQFSVRGFSRGGGFTSTYGDFLRIGDASHDGWQIATDFSGGDVSYGVWTVSHSTFTTSGVINNTNGGGQTVQPNGTFIHDSNTHTGSLGGMIFPVYLTDNATTGTGTRSIQGNSFDVTMSDNFFPGGFTIANNYFAVFPTFGGSLAWASTSGNFIRTNESGTAGCALSLNLQGDIANSYVFVDSDCFNSHTLNSLPATIFPVATGMIVGQGGNPTGDTGEFHFGGPQTSVSPHNSILKNSIGLPGAGGGNTIKMGAANAGFPNVLTFAEHNTWYTGGGGASNGLTQSEGSPSPVGQLTSFRANVLFNGSVVGYTPLAWNKIYDLSSGIGTVTTDVGSPANVDYNFAFGAGYATTCTLSTCISAFTNQGRGYAGKYTSTPGVHDVDVDPQFVDYQRTMELYDSKGLGNHPATWSGGGTYAQGDFVSSSTAIVYWALPVNYRCINVAGCTGAPQPGATSRDTWAAYWEWATLYRMRQDIAANGNASTFIADMMAWIRSGWTPTAAAYRVTFSGDTNAVTNIGATQMTSVSSVSASGSVLPIRTVKN